MAEPCTVRECEREARYRSGLCDLHYQRARRGIQADAPTQKQATKAELAAVLPEIRRRVAAGDSYAQIGRRLGIAATTVSRVCRQEGIGKPPVVIPHGTPSGWQHHRCTCEVCTRARSEYKRAERLRRLERRRITAQHGTRLAYEQGCRCAECRAAAARQSLDRNARTRPAARRSGAPWTGADASIAMRKDLTIEQRAVLLGRTFAAVDDWIRAYQRRPDDPFGIKD